jgi:hypothetical protein
MKKKGHFIFLFLLVLSAFLVTAENQTATDTKAYACLESKVTDKCSTLSAEEKIFSLLAIGKCKNELLTDESSAGCWPKDNCQVKTTSQAVLALRKSGDKTVEAENWILSKSITSPNVEWFLQVETNNGSSCTVSYSDSSYVFSLNENKEISRNAGTCLTVYKNYWFKVSPTCYSQEFKISCTDSFLTSLLYRKKSSQATYDFYVSDKTSSASGEGATTEKVESSCFSKGTSCDYEGTLWATVILKYLGRDVSAYIPYLITMAEDNSKYIPESFLYTLTNNFKVDLLSKQKESKYWSDSGDKFYDTAIALFPFQNDEALMEKTNSKSWLQDVQGNNGCWQDNLRNTAFLLYSLWAKKIIVPEGTVDCESSNYFCSSSASCSSAGGKILNYSGCLGTNICCDKKKELESCYKQGGALCSSGEECLGGTEVDASDSTSGKACCVSGTCGVREVSECESNQGTCKDSCSDNERYTSDSCSSSEICCIANQQNSFPPIIIILGILIVLVVIGIIFRQKLRELLLRFKSKFGKGKPSSPGGPRFPPTSSSRIYPGAVQRRIIPNQNQPIQRRPVQGKNEVDDVLKKLKEIGK